MPYVISYMQNGGSLIGSEAWPRGFEEAKAHAKKAVLVGTAERVEIRDEGGSLVYHYPRVMRPA